MISCLAFASKRFCKTQWTWTVSQTLKIKSALWPWTTWWPNGFCLRFSTSWMKKWSIWNHSLQRSSLQIISFIKAIWAVKGLVSLSEPSKIKLRDIHQVKIIVKNNEKLYILKMVCKVNNHLKYKYWVIYQHFDFLSNFFIYYLLRSLLNHFILSLCQ